MGVVECTESFYRQLHRLKSGEIFHIWSKYKNNKKLDILKSHFWHAATNLDVKMNEMSSTNNGAFWKTVDAGQFGFWHLGKLGEVDIRRAGVQNLAGKREQDFNSQLWEVELYKVLTDTIVTLN